MEETKKTILETQENQEIKQPDLEISDPVTTLGDPGEGDGEDDDSSNPPGPPPPPPGPKP